MTELTGVQKGNQAHRQSHGDEERQLGQDDPNFKGSLVEMPANELARGSFRQNYFRGLAHTHVHAQLVAVASRHDASNWSKVQGHTASRN